MGVYLAGFIFVAALILVFMVLRGYIRAERRRIDFIMQNYQKIKAPPQGEGPPYDPYSDSEIREYARAILIANGSDLSEEDLRNMIDFLLGVPLGVGWKVPG